jgi:hypothetical protein
MKVFFTESVLLWDEDNTKSIWISDLTDYISIKGELGYLIECDDIHYNQNMCDGWIKINGEMFSFDMDGIFDEDHLEMWGFEDFSEITSGYIFQIQK